jgi:hypothetical protein
MMNLAGDAVGLDEAIRRLDHALSRLEVRISALPTEAPAPAATNALFEEDRARLAAELDIARARERELESAALAASQALGRAIVGVKAAIGE